MVTWPQWLRPWATELDRLAGGGEPRVPGDLDASVPALEAERDQCYAAALEALQAWMDLGLEEEGKVNWCRGLDGRAGRGRSRLAKRGGARRLVASPNPEGTAIPSPILISCCDVLCRRIFESVQFWSGWSGVVRVDRHCSPNFLGGKARSGWSRIIDTPFTRA